MATKSYAPQVIAARMQIKQFLNWLEESPRTYDETMAAWRTSCPRFSIWEDALADGLVQITREQRSGSAQPTVRLTSRGRTMLNGEPSSIASSSEFET